MSTDLEPGGPSSPDATIEAANLAAKAIRYLNHVTVEPEALEYPQDIDRLVASMEVLAARMPQLLGQIRDRLNADTRAGRTEIAYGKYEGRRELAAEMVALKLEVASARFADASKALQEAHQITSAISGMDTGDDGSGEG